MDDDLEELIAATGDLEGALSILLDLRMPDEDWENPDNDAFEQLMSEDDYE